MVEQLVIIGKVAVSMILAGLIGLEREAKERPAGLRTHMLVGGAAALFVVLAQQVTQTMSSNLGENFVEADPVRIIQAVVIGVSFIGAGTILQRKSDGQVVGLTTAASLLFAAGVGIGVAIDLYIATVGVTILTLLVLQLLHLTEGRFGS